MPRVISDELYTELTEYLSNQPIKTTWNLFAKVNNSPTMEAYKAQLVAEKKAKADAKKKATAEKKSK